MLLSTVPFYYCQDAVAPVRVHHLQIVLTLVCAVAKITMMVLNVRDVSLVTTTIPGASSVHVTPVDLDITPAALRMVNVPVRAVSVDSIVISAALGIMVFLIVRLANVIQRG